MPTKSASKIITRDPNWLGPAIAPGEILLAEFLEPLGIGQADAARRLGISLNRFNEIVLGNFSPNSAWGRIQKGDFAYFDKVLAMLRESGETYAVGAKRVLPVRSQEDGRPLAADPG